MVSTVAVSATGFFHWAGTTFFLTQAEDLCSPAPTWASWVCLLAVLGFISELKIYPYRFMHMHVAWQYIVEIIASIFIAEFLMLIIWCGVERVIYISVNELLEVFGFGVCNQSSWEYILHGVTTTSAATAALFYILAATDKIESLDVLWDQIVNTFVSFCNVMICFFKMSPTNRRRVLKLCKMFERKNNRGCKCSPNQEENEDDD